MREYKTLRALRDGEIISLDGLNLKMAEGEIGPGDLYIAERNTGPYLLTCKKIVQSDLEGWVLVFPTTNDYPYDIGECVKVCEA